MAKAGVASGTLREKAGKYGRKVAERSFHSLRHSYVTALSAAGVAVELRQKLAGHSSESQSLLYTHPEFAALRSAIEKLPGLREA
jgi:integrase